MQLTRISYAPIIRPLERVASDFRGLRDFGSLYLVSGASYGIVLAPTEPTTTHTNGG